MAGLLSDLSPEIYDSNDYVMQVWDSIGAELIAREDTRTELQKQRDEEAQRAVEAAQLANANYVQQMYAAYSDMIQTASTVPAVVDQSGETIKNDDVLEQTVPKFLSGNIIIDGQKYTPTDAIYRALFAMAQTCGIEGNDPNIIAKQLNIDLPAILEGNVKAYNSFMQKMGSTISSDGATLDCSKEVAGAMLNRASAEFAKELWGKIRDGKLTPAQFMATFDKNMANVGTQMAKYIGAALGGIPSSTTCNTAMFTRNSIIYAETAQMITSGLGKVAALGEFGASLMNQANNLYLNGPDLLIGMVESTTQNAVGMAFMAARIAAKKNCDIAYFMDFATGSFTYGEAFVKGGIKILNSAQKMGSALDGLITSVQNKDFVGELKEKVKEHPCIRTMDTLIKGTNVDIRTYLHLTKNGIKYARISLGADRQHKLSSMAIHSKYISDAWTWGYIKRQNWSTDTTCNRYNEYGMSRYHFGYSYN